MKRKIKRIITIMVFSLICTPIIKAKDIEIIGESGVEGLNTACGVYGGYVACYDPGFRFRVTMVDENGQKVAGTHSVDFRVTNNSSTKTTILNKNQIGAAMPYSNYKYKYGENENPNDFRYIQLYVDNFNMKPYLAANGNQTVDKYEPFMNALMTKIKNRDDLGFYYNGSNSIDFLTLFLSYSGYINQTEKLWKKLETFPDEYANIINPENNYYMIIEPTYLIYYNDRAYVYNYNYVYGTSAEIAQYLRELIAKDPGKYTNGGFLVGLSSNFLYNIGCNMKSTHENSIGFKGVRKDPDCSLNGLGLYASNYESRPKRLDKMEWMYNSGNAGYTEGYGLYVTKLIGEGSNPTTESLTMDSDLCSTTVGNLNSSITNISKDELNYTQYFKVSSDDADANVFCSDSVKYDFSKIISKLTATTNSAQKYGTTISKDDLGVAGTLTVNRRCAIDKTIASAKDYYEDTSMFKDVTLHVYDADYKLKGEVKQVKSTGKVNTTTDITIEYKLEKDIEVKPTNLSSEGYLSFSDLGSLYGYNAKLVNKFGAKSSSFHEISPVLNTRAADKTPNDTDYTLTLKTSNNATTAATLPKQLCKFPTAVVKKAENVVFRTIDLKNPFPGRDGTTRMPGVNWINQYNYVYDYITNNRGVPDEEVYDLEPLYKITLTPAEMMKIRENNKKVGYINDKKTCVDGLMCKSEFLQNLSNKVLTGGTCAKINYTNSNGYTKTKCAVDNANGKKCSTYTESMDKNRDGVIDINDLENIKYYSCADKSPVSGGYWKE